MTEIVEKVELTEKQKEMMETLDSLENLDGFDKIPLPKWYCDIKGIDFMKRHRTPTLKELLDKNPGYGSNPKNINNAEAISRVEYEEQQKRMKQMETDFRSLLEKLNFKILNDAEAPKTETVANPSYPEVKTLTIDSLCRFG